MIDPVLAYLDPASGSIAYQAAISGLLAGATILRLYWKKLKRFVAWKRTTDGASAEPFQAGAHAVRAPRQSS
jgi:membrane associated rhomboid family serine protease